MKIKQVFIIVTLLFITLFAPQLVEAHVLKFDGNIGAVLHIDPEDDPIVGEQSSFFFEFKDKQNKFKPDNCECIFSILQADKEIYYQPLFQNNTDPSLKNASVFFTFPSRDIYKIKVVGKPDQPDTFQQFTLEYDIRVERVSANLTTAQNAKPMQKEGWINSHIAHIGVGLIILIGVIITLMKQRKIKV